MDQLYKSQSIPMCRNVNKLDYPTLLSSIVAIPIENGVVIDGLGKTEVIRGPLAQTILPTLLSLLDGTRTLRDLEGSFPSIPTDYICQAISMLSGWGLIEGRSEDAGKETLNDETAKFLQRALSVAGLEPNHSEAALRLLNAKIGIVSSTHDEPLANLLKGQLVTTGIDQVYVNEHFYQQKINNESGWFGVAVCVGGEDTTWFKQISEENDLDSLLRIVIDHDQQYVDVGPIFDGSHDSCYSCFYEVHGRNTTARYNQPELGKHKQDVWAGFVALEIIEILAVPPKGLKERQFRRFNSKDYSSHHLFYPRLPHCKTCFRESTTTPKDRSCDMSESALCTNVSYIYEEYLALEIQANESLRSQLIGPLEKSYPRDLQTSRYNNLEKLPLYRGHLNLDMNMCDVITKVTKVRQKPINLRDLTAILATAGGVRESTPTFTRRWNATAGNLGSVEIYVVIRDVEGLESGLYYFDAVNHTIVAIKRRVPVDLDQLICAAANHQGDCAAATLLFVGSLEKLTAKYSILAYRLMHLDAGVASSQALMTCRSLGIDGRVVDLASGEVIRRELDLRSTDYQPTVALEISGHIQKERVRKRPQREAWRLAKNSEFWKSAKSFADLDNKEIASLIYRQESLSSHSVHHTPHHTSARDAIGHMKLSSPRKKGAAFGTVLGRRRSIRNFDHRSVDLQDLATVLYGGVKCETEESPNASGVKVQCYIIANRVSRVPAAVYEYDSIKHCLYKYREALSRAELSSLLIQQEFVEAPLLILIGGDLAEACTTYEVAGHRWLLQRAGRTVNRIWLSAMGIGLDGCLIAGLLSKNARTILKMNGLMRFCICAVALGHSDDTVNE